jgi:hypothetical protein
MSNTAQYLQSAGGILKMILKNNDFAKSCLLTHDKMETYHRVIHTLAFALHNIWVRRDAHKSSTEESSNATFQLRFSTAGNQIIL